jgi:ATP-dependent helicase/DNAse subunit B
MPIKLSFSKISTYVECPRKFFLSYICDLGTGSSPHMTNGSLVHKCCEDFEDWPKEDKDFKKLTDYYYSLVPQIDTENLIHESVGETIVINPLFEQKAIKALTSFYEDYKANDYQQVDSGRYAYQGPNRDGITPKIKLQEEWFNIKTKDGHEVRGLIDRVDDEIDGEHIIDYKTGQSRTTFKALKDPLDIKALQLSIYSLARYKKTGKIPIRTSFFYLEPEKKKKVQKGQYRTAQQRTEKDLEKVETFLNEIGNEIEQRIEEKEFPIGDSPNCFWCDFKDKCDILAESNLSDMRNSLNIEAEKPSVDVDTSDWD